MRITTKCLLRGGSIHSTVEHCFCFFEKKIGINARSLYKIKHIIFKEEVNRSIKATHVLPTVAWRG
jgi:hypothetical protein